MFFLFVMYTFTIYIFDIYPSSLLNVQIADGETIQQEHLFIVTELLRANLYEFQKYNQESGDEVYFSLPRIQVYATVLWSNYSLLLSYGLVNSNSSN